MVTSSLPIKWLSVKHYWSVEDEFFICPRHRKWFIALDNYFPFFRTYCECEDCRREKNDSRNNG
ncbi:hypothetical protein MLDJOKPK_00244 [Salmonella phage SPAsTU]|nr:hypothetical protein MLDJOKPK_00244 [Salmonella phage SPAsTU]